ncbi:MAG TPA: ABC transporter ATP-binding protein [Gemmatimonadaceae bacterium]|jgi:ATP-binding cassette subfamily B protein
MSVSLSYAMMRGRQRDPNAPRTPLRERIAALRHVPRLLRLVWETHRGYTVSMVVLRIVRSVVPVSTLWVAKLIIDEAILLARTRGPIHHLWVLVGIEMATVIIGELLTRASGLTESLLGDLFTNRISIQLMEHAATLDLHMFEDPEFYDHLERARQGTTGRVALLSQLFGIGQSLLTLGSLSVALAAEDPWLLLLLVISVIPSFVGETHFAALSYSLLFRRTPQRRQLDYVRYVGASDETAKEVQMFGLAPWLISRYRVLSDRFYDENRALSVRKAFVSSGLSLFGTLGYYAAFVVVLLRVVTGAISIGTLTFLAASFRQSRDLIQALLMSTSGIYEQSLYLKDLFDFFDMQPTIRNVPGARAVPRPIQHGFVFEDVGFRYPGSERWAVRHLSFTLGIGERVALVGENGAGKTTLTKLLARLYDPTEGRILLDGIDLRDYDVGEVRRAIGVIFQDFVRYDMRFDENVGVGEVDKVRDYLDIEQVPAEAGVATALASVEPMAPPAAISDAAEKSLAASLLPRLPKSYRQMLGRRFDGGVDLSGGEWQKVALARAYMRDAQVLILDEPTAALDARAEYDVFVRFNALMAGRMAVVISHRFSTVRMADRIIVLKNGEIVEQGAHDDLVVASGLYAELFGMQAAGYR